MLELTNKSFLISKAQMNIITQIRNGLIIEISVNLKELKLDILTLETKLPIDKGILLALMRRQLIKVETDLIDDPIFALTPLGNRMANIGLKPENVGKVIFAKAPTQKDIKASMGVKINGKEIEAERKKKAKQSYNRKVKQSYIQKP